MEPSISIATRQTIHALDLYGTTTLRSLELARRIVHELITAAGFEVVFDPDSDPDLLDYVGGAALGMTGGAIIGASGGLALGLLVGYPKTGLLLGGLLGGFAGAQRGVAEVRRGLRLRAAWVADGSPEFVLTEAK